MKFKSGITLLVIAVCASEWLVAEEVSDRGPGAAVSAIEKSERTPTEPGFPVKTSGCDGSGLENNAAIPIWDTPASTTPCGALETDQLFSIQDMGGGVHQSTISSLARYGVTPRLELRWGLPGRARQTVAGKPAVSGTTDQWLGACYRFRDQGSRGPDLAVDFAIKIPTANPAKQLGSGYYDELLTLIASRDLGTTHVDFNAAGSLTGGPGRRDGAVQLGMAVTRPVSRKLLGALESYGGTQPATSQRYAAVLVGAAWSLRPALALNAGYARAVTAGSPREQILGGFIYSFRSPLGRGTWLKAAARP